MKLPGSVNLELLRGALSLLSMEYTLKKNKER